MFFGHRNGMSRRETLATPYAELMDLMACEAIYHGVAKEKTKPKTHSLSLWEACALFQ